VEARTAVVQGGAYAEHQFTRVRVDGIADATLPTVEGSAFALRLAPGCGATLQIEMQRYANPPTLTFPWDRS
jgi:hypothetical protein